jgi:divalent metal cation (Fe/Co/Zn/Cd) transporter
MLYLNMDSSLRTGKFLEYVTLGWNAIGVIVLVIAVQGIHSIALIGFGFDTLLEIGASIIVIWELNGTGDKRQTLGLKLLSIAFFALGIYIFVQSILNLLYRTLPGQSLLGTTWLLLTIVVMIILAFKKFKVGKFLNNPVLLTEGRVTLVDAALAFIVLLSMLFTALLGWWWLDSIGGLILMGYCFWEAIHIYQGLKTKSKQSI